MSLPPRHPPTQVSPRPIGLVASHLLSNHSNIPQPRSLDRESPPGSRGGSSDDLIAERRARSVDMSFNVESTMTALATTNITLFNKGMMCVHDLQNEYAKGIGYVFQFLRNRLPKVFDAEYCLAYNIDEEKENEEIKWTDNAGETHTHKMHFSLVGYCATSGQWHTAKDFASDKRYNKNVDIDVSINGRTQSNILIMPIRDQNRTIVVLSLVNKRQSSVFSEDDVLLLRVLGSFIRPLLVREMNSQSTIDDIRSTYMGRTTEMLDFAMRVTGDLEIEAVGRKIMNEAKSLLGAERCALFIRMEGRDELELILATGGAKGARVPLGSGIAGSVARTGEMCVCNDPYSDPRFDRTLDDMTGFFTRNILCAPLKWNNEVIGVAQLTNKSGGNFNEQDLDTLRLFSKICAIAMHNSKLYQEASEAKQRSTVMLTFLQQQVEAQMFSEALNSVMLTAKSVLHADRCSLFVLDRQKQELRTRHADGMKELRFPMKVGVAGQCATTGKSVMCNDAYASPNFYYAVDEQTRYRTASLLAVPVMAPSGEVVAVVEMINKKTGPFENSDQELLETFAAMAGRYLQWEQMGPLLLQQPGQDFLEKFRPQTRQKEALLSWDFNLFDHSTEDLMCLIVYMFDILGLTEKFGIPKQALVRFVWSVARSYKRDVPYHNFQHAFDVTHAMFLYIMHGGLRDKYLTDLDVLTLMISATCHDLNHQGYTNSFMEKADTPFGMLYKNGAIMEHHHISVLLSILNDKANDILVGLSEPQQREVWQDIMAVILATDASHHVTQTAKFKMEFSEDRHQFDKNKKAHRRLLMAMLISWADTSNIVRPFRLAKRWALMLSKEFFQEGDLEKELQIPVPAIFDREKTALDKLQIGFIANVGIPSYTLLKNFMPALSGRLEQLQKNLQEWKNWNPDADTDSDTAPASPAIRCESVDEF